ncbi:nicotinate phosphoribosyltransferase [Streptomyces bottropensis]|nr:hypothetical protein [Streptomyces bottropensis]
MAMSYLREGMPAPAGSVADLAGLPPAALRIRAPMAPQATTSQQLSTFADQVRRRIVEQTHAPAARWRSPERSTYASHRSVPS